MRGSVARDQLSGRKHDIRRLQVVARETELPIDHSKPSAHREAGESYRRTRTTGDGDGVGSTGGVEVDQSGARSGGHLFAVDRHSRKLRDVDHESVAGRPTAVAVSARANRQSHAVITAEADRLRDVAWRPDVGDRLRMGAVEDRVVGERVGWVGTRVREHEAAVEGLRERCPVGR